MNFPLIAKTGVVLGILLGVWTFIMGFAGWYKDPFLALLFWVVVLIQIAVILITLRKTARMGQGYGAQAATGTLVSLIAGVIVIGNSLLFTTVVFPNYFQELRDVQAQLLADSGMTADQIQSALDAAAPFQTSGMQALFGFLGTVITGLVLSLLIAAFVRARPQSTAAPVGGER